MCSTQALLKPLHMSSVAAGWLGCQDEFCCLFIWKVSSLLTWMKTKKHNQNS